MGVWHLAGLKPGTMAVLALAAALPIAAVAGLRHAIERAQPATAYATSQEVLDREGVLLRPFPVADGRWRLATDPDRVDSNYLQMLMIYEDRRFGEHHGVDLRALLRAGLQMLGTGRIVSGGSTLTMQVARLLAGADSRTAGRKVGQLLDALALEQRLDKKAILRIYLNRAPFGGNIEGVRTASLAYFGKEPVRLSAAEAALLVALPQAPEARRPDRDPAAAKRARDRVLRRAAEAGLLDRIGLDRALATPVPDRRRPMPTRAAHLAERARALRPGEAAVRLPIRAGLQVRLEQLARERLDDMPSPLSLAVIVAEIGSGDIVAAVGAPDYFDRRRDGFIDMSRAVRSPGSTLKPLIYALAFSDGLAHPESLIEDRPMSFAGYAPNNFDRDFQGTVTVRQALQQSLNIPAVQLLDAVGPARLMQALRRSGAEPRLPPEAPANLSMALGGVGLSLRDLVAVYGMLAGGGARFDLNDGLGPAGEGGGRRSVVDPRAAWMISDILAGTRDPAGVAPGSFAFKTGTSYGYRDAWAIGFDSRHVVGVWTGRADGRPVPGLVGIEAAAPLLADVFARIGPIVPLPPRPPALVRSSNARLPARLRHVGVAADRGVPGGGPELAFPPDRARIELANAGRAPLYLKVRNGRLPLTYFVNGAPIARNSYSRQATWRADTEGFVDIVVVDAGGAAARARVFLK